jgi:hypothetical protein
MGKTAGSVKYGCRSRGVAILQHFTVHGVGVEI